MKKLLFVDYGQKQEILLGCAVKSIYLKLVLFQKVKGIMKMSEKSESKRLGAKQHKNSGRNTHKGDATWKNFTVDFKEVGKSFTLNKKVWAKAVTDAIKNNSDPAIVIVLGEPTQKVRLAIIELDLLEQLLEEENGTK